MECDASEENDAQLLLPCCTFISTQPYCHISQEITLRNAVEQHTDAEGNVSWEAISAALGDGRSVEELKQQWYALLKPKPEGNTGSWTLQEVNHDVQSIEVISRRTIY